MRSSSLAVLLLPRSRSWATASEAGSWMARRRLHLPAPAAMAAAAAAQAQAQAQAHAQAGARASLPHCCTTPMHRTRWCRPRRRTGWRKRTRQRPSWPRRRRRPSAHARFRLPCCPPASSCRLLPARSLETCSARCSAGPAWSSASCDGWWRRCRSVDAGGCRAPRPCPSLPCAAPVLARSPVVQRFNHMCGDAATTPPATPLSPAPPAAAGAGAPLVPLPSAGGGGSTQGHCAP